MKKRLQELIAGILLGTLSTGGIAFAKTGTEIIEAVYQNLKIYIDGVQIEPKDANGNTVEPFIYNGTTYLPVRAVGEAFGKTVSYDGNTKSVYVGINPNEVQYLLDVCPPYATKDYNWAHPCVVYTSDNTESFYMAGVKYSNGLTMAGSHSDETYALFNLDGKYESLELMIGPVDGNEDPSGIAFIVDGKIVAEYTVEEGDYPEKIKVPLNYGLQLKIVTTSEGRYSTGLGNIVVK